MLPFLEPIIPKKNQRQVSELSNDKMETERIFCAGFTTSFRYCQKIIYVLLLSHPKALSVQLSTGEMYAQFFCNAFAGTQLHHYHWSFLFNILSLPAFFGRMAYLDVR